MKKLIVIIALLGSPLAHAVPLFSDDFTAANGTALSGYNGWTAVLSGGTGATTSATIQNNQAALARSNGATITPGTIALTRDVSSVYNTTLANNTGPVFYGIQTAALTFNPGSSFNWAYVIGATDADIFNAGNGYFLATDPTGGGVSNTDVLMFGYYTNGLGTMDNANGWTNATVLLSTSFAMTGFGGSDAAIRLNYDADMNRWELYANANGALDPDTLGTGDLVGTVTDGTYTASALNFYGVGFGYTGTNNTAVRSLTFDNVSITVPVPATLALFGIGLAALGAARRRSS